MIEVPDGTIVEQPSEGRRRVDVRGLRGRPQRGVRSKLLLLDASGLNKVIADNNGGLLPDVSTAPYADPADRPANVMIDGLDGGPWLRSIDSDHSWRADRLPAYTTPGHGHHGTAKASTPAPASSRCGSRASLDPPSATSSATGRTATGPCRATTSPTTATLRRRRSGSPDR